ncbi:uncharacterized protein PHACADRAFT_166963 [Phanerochaete carnosa HHB-10118-sp]|uniref:Uncharacterized protein n=1 Tax=Phanerochaete carnosa (strain HHB-10118-sp) TaxID=650164 RepID=K5VEK8_PHACS|nr:uncharacterized protein PHACADRAFT_166963 [Phanerochaete carnosa HHB-10118-sp]EKM49598.1 hypothetical protein PHACADRAFT_166963 [Phanerochaete carnosa HHB-10118-sp]
MNRASAADIPQELFPLIISYALDECFLVENFFVRSVERHIIGQFSLVCSYWGKNCRPCLFAGSTVTIKGCEDVLALSRLLQPPVQVKPPFRKCLESATFVLSTTVLPWIEMASCVRSLSNLEFSLIQCTLEQVGNIRTACNSRTLQDHAPGSWSHGLPRTVPSTTLRMFSVHLHGLRFAKMSNLCGLFDLPASLRVIRCRKLEIVNMALSFPSRVRIPRSGTLDVEVSQCGSTESNTAILLSSAAFNQRLATPAYNLGWDTWMAIHKAVQSMMYCNGTDPDAYLDCRLLSNVEPNNDRVSMCVKFLRMQQEWLDALSRSTNVTHQLTLMWGYTPNKLFLRTPATRTITNIRVRFFEAVVSEAVLAVYTCSIEDLILAVGPSTPTIIDIDENVSTFSWFVEHVLSSEETPLRLLHNKAKLKLTLSYRTALGPWSTSELALRDVALQPPQRTVGDDVVTLDPRSRLELCLCTLDLDLEAESAAKTAYLRWVLAGSREAGAFIGRTRKQREELFSTFLRCAEYRAIRASSTTRDGAYEYFVLRENYDDEEMHK